MDYPISSTTTVVDPNATAVTIPHTTGQWNDNIGGQAMNRYYPYGGWWPNQPFQPIYPQPYWPPYTPPAQVVTQQIFIPRGLTEEEIDAIAEKVAEKLAAKRKR